ncbi:DUF3383 family protein [Patescibacteria group bacterium]|nr:DUF3383 family protein [Patescibacteria group bacterium]
MTIPVSTIVDVNIVVSPAFPPRANFSTYNLITNETDVITFAERLRVYNDITGVTADWGALSEVTKAATAYFSQNPRPDILTVSVRADDDQAPQVCGGLAFEKTIATWNAITDGSFAITIGGISADVTGLDFSSDVDLAAVAATIQAGIQAADASSEFTLAKTTFTDRFCIIGGIVGASNSINAFLVSVSPVTGTDIIDELDMAQGSTSVVQGFAAETIAVSLVAIETVSDDWYAFGFTKEVRDNIDVNGSNSADDAAAYAEPRTKIFMNLSNDLNVLNSLSSSDVASTMQTGNFTRTMTIFSNFPDQYADAAAFGVAATVDFNQLNSTITLKFKNLVGISAEDLSQNEKAVLDGKRGNAFIDVGGNDIFAESFMASELFFDEIHNIDALKNAIETNEFGLLISTPKIPLTDIGSAAIEQQLIRALDDAVRNGTLASGTTQAGEFLPNGYITTVQPIADANQSTIDARINDRVSAVALLASATHFIELNINVER